ncbi:MAG: transposase family protein [Chloroflexi bacterium]|nr:transposase family protein [Chloroflexota bacterium]
MSAFGRFGGAPGRVRYDNLKAAVVRVLAGRERVESDRFTALRSHFGFDAFYRAPGTGGRESASSLLADRVRGRDG